MTRWPILLLVAIVGVRLADCIACNEAIQIPSFPFGFEGELQADTSTVGPGCAWNAPTDSMWFTFQGADEWVIFEVFNATFNVGVEIDYGTCSTLTCSVWPDDTPLPYFPFWSVAGVTYYVIVYNPDDTYTRDTRQFFSLGVYLYADQSASSIYLGECGNWLVEPGEECDSGEGCDETTCQCQDGYFPTRPPSYQCVTQDLSCFTSGSIVMGSWLPFFWYAHTSSFSSTESYCTNTPLSGTWFWYNQYIEDGTTTETQIIFSTCSYYTEVDTVLEVYTGSCATGFSCVAVDDDTTDTSCPIGSSKIELTIDPYSDYWILVYVNEGSEGWYDFSIDTPYYGVCPTSYVQPTLGEAIPETLTWNDWQDTYGCWDYFNSGKWYSLADYEPGTYVVSACSSSCSGDLQVWLLSGMCIPDYWSTPGCAYHTSDDLQGMCEDGASFQFLVYPDADAWILVSMDDPPCEYTLTVSPVSQPNQPSGNGTAVAMGILFALSTIGLLLAIAGFVVYIRLSPNQKQALSLRLHGTPVIGGFFPPGTAIPGGTSCVPEATLTDATNQS
ncbi:hypothetical protein Pelo_3833 [Pelomyxa schiedti]|nr:hypothetical protein Pelo_3833 [Pelomyxa schiedti]